DVAVQFDAEDGADRHTWSHRREHLVVSLAPASARRDRLLRAVLAAWDLSHPSAWRALLRQQFQGPSDNASPQLEEEVATQLARFTRSETYRHLAGAKECERDLEFLVDCPASEGPI